MVKCRECNKGAIFNLTSETTGRFCKEHKTPDMIDVVNPKCKADGCSRQPCFNFSGERKGMYCKAHKQDGMIDIKDRTRCEHPNCSVRACFNFENETVPKFCTEHKSPDMIDITKITCTKDGCNKQPTFGFYHGKALRCKEHKEDGMRDIKHYDTCENEGCSKRPCFNFPGETIALVCLDHKLDGMVNILEKRKCRHEGCEKRPSYGTEFGKAEYCKEHKKEEMFWVVKRRVCEHEDCTKNPTFGFPGKSELFCKDHKKDGMTDVRHRKCKTPLCDTRPLREGYCARCYIYTFPNSKVSRVFKTKELAVREFLQQEFQEISIVHDKRIDCGLYRPDFSIDMGSHIIIIENDENQHERYDLSCENKRLMSIFKSFSCRPLVMIRFNPDKYDNVRGCWSKDGKLIGDGSKWKLRLQKLGETVRNFMNKIPSKEVTVEYLFYDKAYTD